MPSCRQEYSIHGKVIFIEVLSLGWSEEEDCLFKLISKRSNQEEYLKHAGQSILHVIANCLLHMDCI